MSATKAASKIRLNDELADGAKVYDIDTSLLTPGHLVIAAVLNGRCYAMVVEPTDLIEVAS